MCNHLGSLKLINLLLINGAKAHIIIIIIVDYVVVDVYDVVEYMGNGREARVRCQTPWEGGAATLFR